MCLFVIHVIDDDQRETMETANLVALPWQNDKFEAFANSTFSTTFRREIG